MADLVDDPELRTVHELPHRSDDDAWDQNGQNENGPKQNPGSMNATHQEGEGKSNQDLGGDRGNSEDDSVADTGVKNVVPQKTVVVEELNKCPN